MKDGHSKLFCGYAALQMIALAKVSARTIGFRVPKAVDYLPGTSTTSFDSLLPKDGGISCYLVDILYMRGQQVNASPY